MITNFPEFIFQKTDSQFVEANARSYKELTLKSLGGGSICVPLIVFQKKKKKNYREMVVP